MLNPKRGAVVATLLLVLWGCTSTTVYQKVDAPSQDSALVYVIRKSYPPYAWAGDLKINGVKAASVANDTYAAVSVPVGLSSFEFTFNPIAGGVPLVFGFDAKPNETRYVVLTGDASLMGTESTGTGFVMKFRWSANAFEVNEASGKRLIQAF